MNGNKKPNYKKIAQSTQQLAGKKIVKIVFDAFFLILAYLIAYHTRFDFQLQSSDISLMKDTLPLAILFILVAMGVMRLNQSQWRYSSIQDLMTLGGAITAGWVAFIIFLYFANFKPVPRSILFIYWMLSLIFLGAARFFPRIILKIRGFFSSNKRRVLVIGAGDAGEMIIRQMKNDPKLGYFPVALADDNPKKMHTKLHGVKVMGSTKDLASIVKTKNIDEIIISAPSAGPKQMRRIVQVCETTGIEFKTVPGPKEIVNGSVTVQQLRKVEVEDLLDRTPVEIDFKQIKTYLQDRVVLITGAAGSIGSELSRQILKLHPRKLICLDRTENSLFYLDYELRQMKEPTNLGIVIADILDTDKISNILSTEQPDIVFHAAAYKHVPLMELHPEEAIHNNVIGTLNMMRLSEEYGAEKFVLISTDKAVNPSSVMGASKRMAELILQSYSAQARIKLLTVRFGNVLGSYGSVLPLFQKQIANGGPVTITHPDMERFFMTIPEAVKLILQAARMSAGNDIFVLDMGEPIKLVNIARRLIKLSGYEPDEDIPIKIIGKRPGEKLVEELWNKGEVPLRTDHPKIYSAVGSHYNHWDLMSKNIALLKEYSRKNDRIAIYRKLQEIIPEYTPDQDILRKLEAKRSKITVFSN